MLSRQIVCFFFLRKNSVAFEPFLCTVGYFDVSLKPWGFQSKPQFRNSHFSKISIGCCWHLSFRVHIWTFKYSPNFDSQACEASVERWGMPVASQRWPPPPVISYDRTQEKRRTTWIWSNLMTLENLFTNQDASLRWIWVISVLSEYLTKFKAKIVLNCL